MAAVDSARERSDSGEVRALMYELSDLLLGWSWEGVVGYEEMVEGIAHAYGHKNAMVFMEAQMATIQLDGEVAFVRTGIPGVPPLAFAGDLKRLLADVYDGRMTVAEARAAVHELAHRAPPNPPFLVWLGTIVVAMGFAVDCVGTWEGLFYAALTGVATGLCLIAAGRSADQAKIAPLIAAFASGVIVMLAHRLGWTDAAPGLLLIAATFVFLPGDSISMQAYELAEGRWSAGVDRFFYSVIVLALLATGAWLAAQVTGTPVDMLFPQTTAERFPWWAVYPGRALLLTGIALAFHMDRRHFAPALLLLWAVTAVAQVTSMVGGELFGTLVGATVGMTASLWLARGPRSIPSFVLMVPVVFALSPGSHGLRQFETWLSGRPITGVTDLSTLVGVLLAIGIGLVIGRALGGRWRWLSNWRR